MLIVVAIFQCRKNKESEEIEMKTRTKEDDGKAGNDVIQKLDRGNNIVFLIIQPLQYSSQQ